MAMDAEKKEFLLHLYDKLWENTIAKENRLWSFLSFYGAALALAFAAGQFAGQELLALIVLCGLTLWAALIVLNANWWYARNQLMVTRVENAFAVAIDGIIPQSYRDPRFRLDGLHRASMIVLGTLSGLLYVRVMWLYLRPRAIDSWFTFAAVLILYLFFSASIRYVIREHERHIRSFFVAKQALLVEAKRAAGEAVDSNAVANSLLDATRRSRRETRLRWAALALFIVATVAFDGVAVANQANRIFVLGASALQIVLVSMCAWRNIRYFSDTLAITDIHEYHYEVVSSDGRKYGKVFMLVLAGGFLGSVALNGYGIVAANPSLRTERAIGVTSNSVEALRERVGRAEEELERAKRQVARYEREDPTLQAELLRDQLQGFVTRSEVTRIVTDETRGYVTEQSVRKLFKQWQRAEAENVKGVKSGVGGKGDAAK